MPARWEIMNTSNIAKYKPKEFVELPSTSQDSVAVGTQKKS